MERTKAIYNWVFSLQPFPAGKPGGYAMLYESVPDRGALPPAVLRSRRAKEATSLAAFKARESEIVKMHGRAEVQAEGANDTLKPSGPRRPPYRKRVRLSFSCSHRPPSVLFV